MTRADMAVFLMRGAFNQLLPAGTPVLTQINPSIIAQGQTTTVLVTGANTNFAAGQTTLGPIPGVQIGPVTVLGPGSLSVDLTPAPAPSLQPASIVVITGAEEAVLPNALSVQ